MIVPASRPAFCLQPAIDLAARLGVLLVVLCSKQTRADHVAELVSSSPGARALVVELPKTWRHPKFPTRTSSQVFRKANGYRESDLSAKRNIGLLLARLHGWNKIVFVDDDVRLSRTDNVARLAEQLDRYQVAGMIVRNFPDNSVVCHARRDAGLPQDVFLTGAVLGVHCNSLPLSFFPDIYNEDWFFFAREAAAASSLQWARPRSLSTTRLPVLTALVEKSSVICWPRVCSRSWVKSTQRVRFGDQMRGADERAQGRRTIS